jgi:hypothetical protein
MEERKNEKEGKKRGFVVTIPLPKRYASCLRLTKHLHLVVDPFSRIRGAREAVVGWRGNISQVWRPHGGEGWRG